MQPDIVQPFAGFFKFGYSQNGEEGVIFEILSRIGGAS